MILGFLCDLMCIRFLSASICVHLRFGLYSHSLTYETSRSKRQINHERIGIAPPPQGLWRGGPRMSTDIGMGQEKFIGRRVSMNCIFICDSYFCGLLEVGDVLWEFSLGSVQQ
jgi:hypothetical protein